jgi:hypothetical protein
MVDQNSDIYKSYADGYLLRDAQVRIARGFELTGLFPKAEVDTKKVNVVKSTPLDKFVDKTGKLRKLAKGARARQIRGEVETTDGLNLTQCEIEYIIEDEDLHSEVFDLQGELGAMYYILAQDIEEVVYNKIVAEAAISSSSLTGNWDDAGATLETIIEDIVQMESEARDTPYRLNWFAYGSTAHNLLLKKAGVSIEDYTIPQNEFTIDGSISLQNARHFYGSREMGVGEILGGDIDNPGLRLFYKKYNNPNVKQAPMPVGMEKFLPTINMMMYDNAETQSDPETTIKVTCAVGARAMNDGAGLFRHADITV